MPGQLEILNGVNIYERKKNRALMASVSFLGRLKDFLIEHLERTKAVELIGVTICLQGVVRTMQEKLNACSPSMRSS